jgi:hypothetical protein
VNGHIEIEKHGSLTVIPHHALNPEKRGHASAAGDRSYMVEAR